MKATKTCCSLEDAEDARSVAFRLGIPYYVFNFSDDFKGQVIDRFYLRYIEHGRDAEPLHRLQPLSEIRASATSAPGFWLRRHRHGPLRAHRTGKRAVASQKRRSMRARTRATCSIRSRRSSSRTRVCRSARCTKRDTPHRGGAGLLQRRQAGQSGHLLLCRTATTLALSRATRAATAPAGDFC